MNHHKYLLMMGLPLALMSGCAQNATAEATGDQTHPGAQAEPAPTQLSPTQLSPTQPAEPAGSPAPGAMGAHALSTRLSFSSDPSVIPVGRPVTWTLKITDAKTGAPANDFETEMTKKMHLIVVKNDLSWFNHIHPTLGQNGTFVVTATLPKPGTYKLYADYTLKGRGQQVPQYELATDGGQPTPSTVALVPDKMQGPWLVNKFTSHPDSNPEARGGAAYQVAMMPMPMPLKAGQNTMLHFQIRDAGGKPIKDLQPYLGAMGHCVILSGDTTKYLHSHPMAAGMEHDMSKMGAMDMSQMNEAPAPKSGGPDVMFHTNFPAAGLYKVWGQFQHRGQIITASFVVNVAPGAPASASSQGASDESKPHTH